MELSWFFRVFRKQKKYVLKGRCDGQTEELGVYDYKITMSEAMSTIDGIEERCTSIWLDEYDGDRKITRVWSKPIPRRRVVKTLKDELRELAELRDVISKLAGNQDPSEYFASAVMFIKSLKELQKELGAESGKSYISDLLEIIKVLTELRMYSGAGTASQPIRLPPNPAMREEAERVVDRIIQHGFVETSKSIAPCTAGVCDENATAQE